MTLQQQYNLIKEGKGNKAQFLKNAKFQFPNLFNAYTSYDDAATVLKSKGLIAESTNGAGGVVTGGREQDWVTTSNQQTKAVIEHLDPRIVLFGGLHKDLCMRGVLLDINDHNREYVESDLLSYTWQDTLKKFEDYTRNH